MDVSIHTAHHVSMDYTPAGLWERMLATLIDLLIIFSIYFVLLAFTLAYDLFDNDKWLWVIAGIALIVSFYHLISEVALNGRSVGKIAMHLQVIKLNGEKLSFWDCLLRWMFRLVDVVFSTGAVAIISVIFTKHAQRLGDLAAGTLVVKQEKKVTLAQLNQYETPEEYRVVFPQANLLSDKDIVIIKEVLKEVKRTQAYSLLDPLTQRIKSTTGIETQMDNLDFVQTILRDYTHLTQS